MKITAARQRNAVSEGAALGLLMSGHSTIASERWRTDLAFEGAWRDWSGSRTFPQVDTDLRQGLNGTIAMTRADERKHTFHLFWDTTGGQPLILQRQPWLTTSPDDMAAGIDGGLAASRWQELAEEFLRHLDL